ncbi:hypothetical protein [Pseudokineococcus sp. 1T1Z-3]|uniref:hypothetical protein n=1 Tax=Pseudokineococcus sp. 1T1Z-3 TaxID=3132745 RepID=UPI0030A839AA
MSHRMFASRRAGAAGAGLALAVVLAGCAEQPLPAPAPQEVAGAAPAVTAERAAQVHAAVAADAAEADAARDVALLEPRVTGAAAELREARYRLQELLEEAPGPTPLDGEVLLDVVPAVGVPGAEQGQAPARAVPPAEAAATFPRTWMGVTQVPGAAPQLVVLVQDDARSPYRAVATTSLLPGAELPQTLAPEVGAPLLAPDAQGLALAPEEALSQYAAALEDPDAAEAARFGDDAFREAVLAERAAAEAVDFFAVETSRGVRPGSVTAVPTADGGALVVGVMDSEVVQQVEEAGAVLTLSEAVAALAGTEDAEERVASRYLEVVALAVPPAPEEGAEPGPVQVVGADRVLVEAEAS